MPAIGWLPVSSDVLEAQEALIRKLAAAGATVRVAQPEALGDLRDHHALYLSMLRAATSARLQPEERERQAQFLAAQTGDDEFATARAAGLRASIGDWFAWHARREAYRAAYRAFFKEWDVLIAPITLRTAFPHLPVTWPPSDAERTRTVEIDGRHIDYEHQLVYPGLATLAGQPATAFPVGLSRAGLPVGLQAIGPYLEDRTPIRFAGLATDEMGGLVSPPGYGPHN
jgi:amidase